MYVFHRRAGSGSSITTYKTVVTSLNRLQKQAPVSAVPASDWLATARLLLLLSWIDGVFAAPSRGRWIRSNCSGPWISVTIASTFATLPGFCSHPFPPWPGCSTTWVWAAEKSRAQALYPALRAGPIRRPDPYRRQKARPLSQRRLPHHRQPPAGPLHGRWLRPRLRSLDDASRVVYVEVLADEQQATAIGLMSCAVAWFTGQGVKCRQVMSDQSPSYVARRFAKARKVLILKHIRIRPHTLRTSSKADRLIQTLRRERNYGMPFHLGGTESVAQLPVDP